MSITERNNPSSEDEDNAEKDKFKNKSSQSNSENNYSQKAKYSQDRGSFSSGSNLDSSNGFGSRGGSRGGFNSGSSPVNSTNRPHSIEAEEALLGAMLTTPDAVAIGFEEIKDPECFFKPTHQIIFKAMRELFRRGTNIDILTLGDYLEKTQEDEDEDTGFKPKISKGDLQQMRQSSPAPTHVGDYAKIIKDHYMRRKLQTAAELVIDLVAEDHEREINDVIAEAEGLIYSSTQERLAKSIMSLGKLYDEFLRELEELFARGNQITGVPTGFIDLDEILSGLQRQNLIVVGARPSQGKTSFALQIASNIARAKPVLFFSMEMSSVEITRRVVAQQTRVGTKKLQNGQLTAQEWQTLVARMENFVEAELHIDDNPALTVTEMRAKALRTRSEVGELGAVFVDYIQLMSSPKRAFENRQAEVSEISRGLKILARELDCPVIALSQLSRNVENRGDKQPVLADLRESGSIEQDADVVLFLYRDIYDKNAEQDNITDVSISKHRSGPIGNIQLHWDGNSTRFSDAASSHQQVPPEYLEGGDSSSFGANKNNSPSRNNPNNQSSKDEDLI